MLSRKCTLRESIQIFWWISLKIVCYSLTEIQHPPPLRLIINKPGPNLPVLPKQRTVIFHRQNPGIHPFFLRVHPDMANRLNLSLLILYLQHQRHDFPCAGKPALTRNLFLYSPDTASKRLPGIDANSKCHDLSSSRKESSTDRFSLEIPPLMWSIGWFKNTARFTESIPKQSRIRSTAPSSLESFP